MANGRQAAIYGGGTGALPYPRENLQFHDVLRVRWSLGDTSQYFYEHRVIDIFILLFISTRWGTGN